MGGSSLKMKYKVFIAKKTQPHIKMANALKNSPSPSNCPPALYKAYIKSLSAPPQIAF